MEQSSIKRDKYHALDRFSLKYRSIDELGWKEEAYQDRATCEDRVRYLKKEYSKQSKKLIWQIKDKLQNAYWMYPNGRY